MFTGKRFLIFLTCLINTSSGSTRRRQVFEGCNGSQLVPRREWEARPAGPQFHMRAPARYIVVHHVRRSPYCRKKAQCANILRNLQNYQMGERGWSDIGYHYMIGGDANVYEGRAHYEWGSHTRGYNSQSISIAFMGDYNSQPPPSSIMRAARILLRCAVRAGYVSWDFKLFGHRDAECSSCPGDALYHEVKKLPHFRAPENFQCAQL